jgi:hypothetical protein
MMFKDKQEIPNSNFDLATMNHQHSSETSHWNIQYQKEHGLDYYLHHLKTASSTRLCNAKTDFYKDTSLLLSS